MGEAVAVVLGVVYVLAAGGLLLFSLNAYWLVFTACRRWRALREGNAAREAAGRAMLADAEWPAVTTQIPLYNESAVARRVMEAVAGMAYPAGRHEIQVLDDSTDETREIVDATAAELRERGVRVEVVRRRDRVGYKAGALAEGMRVCQGSVVAIFDADFVPSADFLLRTVPHLVAEPGLGWVQGRWGHLNEEGSLLTMAQGLGIDGHFAIDQGARCGEPSWLMNFNGSGGVWRRSAIEEAGGWQADTLTEDLDLSFRAQMRGWRGGYLPEVVVPGELPADVAGYKSQQFRWAKGSIQTAMKLGGELWRGGWPWMTKVQAGFHLCHYAMHPLIVLMAVFSLVVPWVLSGLGGWGYEWLWWPISVLSIGPMLFTGVGQVLLHADWGRRLLRLPWVVLAGVGLALSNSMAVLEALVGKESGFVRTPKQGEMGLGRYRVRTRVPAAAEAWGAVVCFVGFAGAVWLGRGWSAQFLLLVGAGFLFIALAG